MALLGVRVNCYTNGKTLVSLCFNAIRSGSDNDKAAMRIVRRRSGYADYVLPGTADFTLRSTLDIFSWQWIDPDVPASGEWDYVLQIYRRSGAGTFYEMNLNALHFRR